METPEELTNRIAQLEAEPASILADEASSSSFETVAEPLAMPPAGKQWVDLGGIAGRRLIDYPVIQPENDQRAKDIKLFRPSKYQRPDDYDAWYIAIPAARWPQPGAPMTPRVWQRYHEELVLCAEANNRLREYCYWLRHEKLHLEALPPAKETDGLRERADRSLLIDAEQRAAEHVAWLTGLWSARGIPIPTSEELEELAVSRAQVAGGNGIPKGIPK